jgi:hypothetical protein
MNLLIRLIILLLITVTAASRDCHAQEPCQLECDVASVPYTMRTAVTSLSGTCSVKVTAAVRACSGIWEVKLQSIETFGCTEFDIAAIRRKAISQVLSDNLFGLPYPAIWRVASPSCWRRNTGGVLVPCDAPCCVSYLNVRDRNGCGTFEIVGESSHGVKPSCSLSTLGTNQLDNPAVNGPCHFSCDPIIPKSK